MKWNIDTLIHPLGKRACLYLGSVLGCCIIGSVCYNLVLAVIMQKVLDAVEYHDSRRFLDGLLIAAASLLIALIFEPVLTQVRKHCVRASMAKIRDDLSRRIAYQTCASYESLERGDVLARLTGDLSQMERIYLNDIPMLGFAIVHGGIAVILLLYYNRLLALLALALGFVQLYVNKKISSRVAGQAKKRQIMNGIVTQQAVELLDGWTDIVTSHAGRHFIEKFRTLSGKLSDHEKKAELSLRMAATMDGFFSQFNRVIIMCLGLLLVLYGRLSVGAIAAILALQGNAMYLFQNIASFNNQLNNSLPSVIRIEEMKRADMEQTDMEQTDVGQGHTGPDETEAADSLLDKNKAAIAFEDVSFGFGDKMIIEHASLRIPQGAFALLLGESGAGKSTLGKIFLRFYQETDGTYWILGKNSRHISFTEARRQIAYMDQQHKIFSMSVMDNLRLAQKQEDENEIRKICELTGIQPFVDDWKDGYGYVIDDDYSNLSGGQKQRLALARMLLSDRPILLIDEGTSNLDEEAEQIILRCILQYRQKKTILMITHKPEMLPYADVAYELKGGMLRQTK